MTSTTHQEPRAEHFRLAIRSFIHERREAKEKDKNYDAAKYEYATWLAEAARRVGQIQAVTHVLKATHPDARGSSLHVLPSDLPQHREVGSHCLGSVFSTDVVGNAAALDVFKFLKIEVEGRALLDWMRSGNAELRAALSSDQAIAESWMSAFAGLVRPVSEATSHPMAKQLYWLVGDDPCADAQFHLLQPLFSSALAHAVHEEIQDARFGDLNKQARRAFRNKELSDTSYREYRDVVVRKLGGTKPQNISQLNSERGGMNYLVSSLPPPAWQPRGLQLMQRESAFMGLLWFGEVRELVEVLAEFLKSGPPPNAGTRARRISLEQAICQELANYGAAVRGSYEPGWTRASACRLPLSHQLWLDPERTDLPPRHDPENPGWLAEDEEFNAAYHRGDWAEEVATHFADWLNAQLHRAGLVAVSLPERNHWARQAVMDVAWPVPMQRRAIGGGL